MPPQPRAWPLALMAARGDTPWMPTLSRCIRLRRPAVLASSSGRFVPSTVSLEAVDEAWERARSRNPRLFDGPLWHVQGVSRNGHGGVTVHVVESSYRFHAVRAEGIETGIRPLGVKALTWRQGRVLMGRRSAQVHAAPGRWEFVPGGTLEPGRDPAAQLAVELHEEAGWTCAAPPCAIAIVFDDSARTWELVHRVDGAPGAVDAMAAPPASTERWEYDAIVELAPERIRALPLTHAAALLTTLLGIGSERVATDHRP